MKLQKAGTGSAGINIGRPLAMQVRRREQVFPAIDWLRVRIALPWKTGWVMRARGYRAHLAWLQDDRDAAYRLRFRVFNLELNEGLEHAFAKGVDRDEFDDHCDHIIVVDESTEEVIGTYRLQSGARAARNIGYYSQREFPFAPYESIRKELIELGRACIHADHRKYDVLMLLWKAVIRYSTQRRARYLIGCSSLNSLDPANGAAVYNRLKATLAPECFRTSPAPDFAFPLTGTCPDAHIPKLVRTYLALGAWICGEPAMDREFKTIDFLTLLDLDNLSPVIVMRHS